MRKILVTLLVMALALSMTPWALGEEASPVTCIDFEDGSYGFLGVSKPNGNAADATIEIADFNGSKALKVSAPAKSPYVGINVEGLLGDRLADLRSVSAEFGVDNAEDGTFYAVSGVIYCYVGEANDKVTGNWSVYMAKKNPNSATLTLDDDKAFVPGAGNYVEISKETDNYVTKKGGTPVTFYIDNIQFLDAEGNPLPLDLTAEYVAPSTGTDLSNLWALKDVVEFPDFVKSAGGWTQDGLEMPEDFVAALVPGSVVEIEFSSDNGDIWAVMPDSAAGWMRVGGGGNGTDYVNNSKSIAQIPYETFVEFLGEDVSTWGARMQCEASGNWQVFAVRVGQRVPQVTLTDAVTVEGFTVSGAGWAQAGVDALSEDVLAALVPGSAVEIEFESASGDMWIVMPDSANTGWTRVGQGTATIIGNKAYITFEQIAEACGSENVADWGVRMQCEASDAWSVYSVRVGKLVEIPAVKDFVDIEGFTVSGAGWAQAGVDALSEDVLAALVPGSVVDIEFESASGDMWIVMPDSVNTGWTRVGQGTDIIANGHAYVTFEQLAEACGSENVADWGPRMQCEASDTWSVYSVRVGKTAE